MTRKEAIEILKAYRDKLSNSVSNQLDGDIKAFNVAINSLEIDERYELEYEQIEPCEDAISRQAAIDALIGWETEPLDEDIEHTLKRLPSVKPQVICPSHGIDCKDCPAYEPKTNVLDKIRAEILNFKEKCNASDYLGCGILEIIDKYKAESEDK